MRTVIPVILSGGSGTRLWPLSSNERPKQFLPLVTGTSLFQDTLRRAAALGSAVTPPIVVCNEAHRSLVAEQAREIGSTPQAIVLEPAGRNTAPAVAVAAWLAQRSGGDDALLLVLPADHVVLDTAAFVAAVDAAVEAAAAGYLVTFGIVPDKPETGYGYILRGAERGRWSLLDRFVEKPDRATAEHYVASGRYLWNSGMFVLSARVYLKELERHAPAIYAACREAAASADADRDVLRLGAAFLASPSDSIDYAVMEKTSHAAVVPFDAGWNDVGSWAALHDVLTKDARGNVLRGTVRTVDCEGSYVVSTDRLVAAIGLRDCVVVETPDAVLVVAKEHAQSVKQIVDALKAQKKSGSS
jgi:mannose-1-phosphate guanylyltransferase/mannose-6-phosphate isomerase